MGAREEPERVVICSRNRLMVVVVVVDVGRRGGPVDTPGGAAMLSAGAEEAEAEPVLQFRPVSPAIFLAAAETGDLVLADNV